MDPVIQEFEDLYGDLSAQLQEMGFHRDRPEYTVSNQSRSEVGVEKRALITMGRERIDILYSLPVDKLKALAGHELPYVDRKVRFLHKHIPMHSGLRCTCVLAMHAMPCPCPQTQMLKNQQLKGIHAGSHHQLRMMPHHAFVNCAVQRCTFV